MRVQASQCLTCIYRPNTFFDLERLESEVSDGRGGFKTYRICHHSKGACCAVFWTRYKDRFPLGQISQRLELVEFVNDDTLVRYS